MKKGLWIAAGLLAGAAALTGCSAATTPAVTPTPNTAQQATAQPQTAAPDASQASPDPSAESVGGETPGPTALRVGGKKLETDALLENGEILLPLTQTAQALGYTAKEESVEEENQTRRNIALTKDESRISVNWVVSDNTAERITWQKDGLLIPVDTQITTLKDVVYVPAAFFEEAMKVRVTQEAEGVSVTPPEPQATPETEGSGA